MALSLSTSFNILDLCGMLESSRSVAASAYSHLSPRLTTRVRGSWTWPLLQLWPPVPPPEALLCSCWWVDLRESTMLHPGRVQQQPCASGGVRLGFGRNALPTMSHDRKKMICSFLHAARQLAPLPSSRNRERRLFYSPGAIRKCPLGDGQKVWSSVPVVVAPWLDRPTPPPFD